MSRITIEVDGRGLEAEAGEMLIRVTDRNDIYIPRFCYHDTLSVAANCRMCLVEVTGAPKPMPACATPVSDGMKVFTRSQAARTAQEGTMEFLLINHPLDCPVCDQGGECPLQDQAMGYGRDDSRFREKKRAVPSHDIGPLIATEMTRCIHCTRCVRFGEEIAGVLEMGAPGRGEHMKISTFLDRPIDSEVSGNIIDLCPVGALTSRPYRFAARSWELRNHRGVSPHDCVGANLNVQTLRDVVERVLPHENPDVNGCWLADRDRFSYEAVNSEARLTRPMIRDGGAWMETDWKTALEHVADGVRKALRSGSDVGALASPTATLEEFHLLQKLVRALGSESVDHRLQQADFRDDDIAPALPGSECPVRDYETRANVLLVGSNIRKEQPLLSLRLRQGVLHNGCTVNAINPLDFDFNFDTGETVLAPGAALVERFAALAAGVAEISGAALPDEIAQLAPGAETGASARGLVEAGENGLVILGAPAGQHPDAAVLKAIAHWLGEQAGCRVAVLAPSNSAAARLARCLPGAGGKNAGQMLESGCGAMLLLATEPELDAIDGRAALEGMRQSGFVAQISAFRSAAAMEYADALLPMTAFTENAGTFVNCEGRVQRSTVAAPPAGESRPGWKILRVLGNFLECDGFDHVTLEDVYREVGDSADLENPRVSNRLETLRVPPVQSGRDGMRRIADLPMYRLDATLRHAPALQATADNPPAAVAMNSRMAQSRNLADGDSVRVGNGEGGVTLPLRVDDRVPDDAAYIPAGHPETVPLGGHVAVTVERA